MRTTKLGDLTVSAQGLGCMGMSEWYGATDWDESIATIHAALDEGVTFLDTADVYGAGHNEVLVGRAIAHRRDDVQLATKFGIDRTGGDGKARVLRGERPYVKRAAESSLLRLGVEAATTNQAIADTVREVARAKGVAPAQIALAWVYASRSGSVSRWSPSPGPSGSSGSSKTSPPSTSPSPRKSWPCSIPSAARYPVPVTRNGHRRRPKNSCHGTDRCFAQCVSWHWQPRRPDPNCPSPALRAVTRTRAAKPLRGFSFRPS
jgi:Aldo/keto reductase family